MTTYDEDDLERIFRAGLTHHAADAPAQLTQPLPRTATKTVRSAADLARDAAEDTAGGWGGTGVDLPTRSTRSTRSPWRWAVPAAIAAAVIAIPVAAQWRGPAGPADPTAALGGSASATGSASANGADGATRPNGIPADWRPESYGGVQIWVPPDWGWGGTPTTPEWHGGGRMDCSEMRAFTVPGSSTYEFVPDNTPYVGRPVMMTDACGDGGPDAHPLVEAAWLGAPVDVGTQTYGDGVVRETRLVGGVTVTAFGKDTDRIHDILDSARAVTVDANGCPADPSGQVLRAAPVTSAESLSVCVYDTAHTSRGASGLLFSMTVGADAATSYRKATAAAVSGKTAVTVRTADGTTARVVVGLHGQDASGTDVTRWDVFEGSRLTIPVAATEPGGFVSTRITKALVAPWAKDQGAIKAYVIGPGPDVSEVAPYFRGILG